ncbi:MAG: alpha-amylase family protein [Verrucomicrobiota bacterium]
MKCFAALSLLMVTPLSIHEVRAEEPLKLPFLTPDAEFQGVEPPGWVLEGTGTVFMGLEDLEGIAAAAAAGVTVLHTGGPSLYYPLRRDDPASGVPAAESTVMKAGIAKAKALGMRVILGISPYAPVEIVRRHPDWLLHGTDDPGVREKVKLDLTLPENIALRGLPLNTPYGEYAIDCLTEILRDYGVDGFSFDGCYHAALNFSPWERAQYLRETGRELPGAADLANLDYRIYLLWADEKLEQWYRRLGEKLKGLNPESAICTWTTNAGRYGHFLTIPGVMSVRMNRLIHSPVQEWWLDEGNLGSTVVPWFGAAYIRAAAGGRTGSSEPYLMSHGNPYSTASFPPHEMMVRCLGAMTNGSFTPLAGIGSKPAALTTLRAIQERKPWFTDLRQEPWAAMLVSERSRRFFAWMHVMERFLAPALGIYRACLEEHLPLTLLTEMDLKPEILKKHRVLILPNAVCLSDAQCAMIRDYVLEGGGLVASSETSLADELGRPRADFGLKDLFGVSRAGDLSKPVEFNDPYWTQRMTVGDFRWGGGDLEDGALVDDERLHGLVPGRQATFKGSMMRTVPIPGPMKRAMIYFPQDSREPFPCATIGRQGKGRVVYFAAGVDGANFSYSWPYQRVLLARAIRWAADAPCPVEVKAPMCVQATLWTQPTGVEEGQGGARKAGERRIVHLFNGLNTTADHGLQESEVPLREEAVPIHGILLKVHGSPVAKAWAEPGHTVLPVRLEGAVSVVEVPPVAVHLTVVLEYGP